MGITKSAASVVFATLSVAVTCAALACYYSGLSSGSVATTGSTQVSLSQLLALDRPEAPQVTAAAVINGSNEELKDWSFTARHSFWHAPMGGTSPYSGSYQSGWLGSLFGPSFPMYSSNPYSGGSSYAFPGGGYMSHFSAMHGMGVFHRSHLFSHYSSVMQMFGGNGYGSPFSYGYASSYGSQPYGGQGFWGSSNYSPWSYAYTGTPVYASSYTPSYSSTYTPPSYTPPSYTPPTYTAPAPSYMSYSTPSKSGMIYTGGPTTTTPPTYTPPASSSSYFSSFVRGATDFASSSSFISVRARSLELVSQSFERIVTNVGGVTSTIERTTLVTTVQTEVEVRRFRNPMNASPCA